MAGVVMVEGLPGTGKSTTAYGLWEWLAGEGVAVTHFPEGWSDHPVDFEQVAVLTTEAFTALLADLPADAGEALVSVAESSAGAWVVRYGREVHLPRSLVRRLREFDSYDGAITPELHSRVLAENWRRFGAGGAQQVVQVWECVLLQNPVSALMARFDRPEAVEAHVQSLLAAVAEHSPALVYLDAGDPAPVLERVAQERSDEWVEHVVGYHTGQGYGLARGLEGFDGYVELMRHRRELELELLPRLDLPTLVVPVGDGDWDTHTAAVREFVGAHVGLDAQGAAGSHRVA